jgi:hypothetical protein
MAAKAGVSDDEALSIKSDAPGYPARRLFRLAKMAYCVLKISELEKPVSSLWSIKYAGQLPTND